MSIFSLVCSEDCAQHLFSVLNYQWPQHEFPNQDTCPQDSGALIYIPQFTLLYLYSYSNHTNVVFQQILNGFYFTHLYTKMNPFLHKNSPQCLYFYWWLQTIYCAIIKHGLFLRDCEFEHSLSINSLFYYTPLEITKKNNIRSEEHTYTHSFQGAIL